MDVNNQAKIQQCNIKVIDYYLLLGHLLLLLLLLQSADFAKHNVLLFLRY